MQDRSSVELADRQLTQITGEDYRLSLDDDRWQWTLLRSPRMAWGGGEPVVYAGRDWHPVRGRTPSIASFAQEHTWKRRRCNTAAR